MINFTATYSPDDNKLRLTASARIDAETYARVKAAGFSWAPKLEQFIAPMWTPARADLAIDLAGEIEDDDGSLIDRAEVRAERFEEYSDKRGAEAVRARDYVASITEGIPFGQPILVGHHSQRHAERDAKRIESGMRRAVDAFETAEYWKRRAAAAISHAKYKERADVRHRRIKALEADQRKQAKIIDEHERAARIWGKVPRVEWDKQSALAEFLAGRMSVGAWGIYSELHGGRMHGDTAWRLTLANCATTIAHASRWLDHIENRITYERAMLDEGGGIAAAGFDLQPGGIITLRGRRHVIERVNRRGGAVLSVSVIGRGWPVGVEEITAYEPPTEGAAAAVKAATTKAPVCNYPSEGCATMTQAEWMTIYTDHKGTRELAATPTAATHRRRMVMGFLGAKYGAPRGEAWGYTWVHINDAKRTDPADPSAPIKPKRSTARKIAEALGADTSDAPEAEAAPTVAEVRADAREVLDDLIAPTLGDTLAEVAQMREQREARESVQASGAEFVAMRDALRTGAAVQVVSAPQLFPTPADLARRMVEAAQITHGARVLEPSAGTGRILDAIGAPVDLGSVHAIEVSHALAEGLRAKYASPRRVVHCRDFLTVDPASFELFDAVLMNPPFANGADVAHVTHAVKFLRPGGRLVAVMSAGLNFREDRKTRDFRQLIINGGGTIEALPSGTFESSGTGVNTVLVIFDAPGQPAASAEPAQVALI